VGFGLVLEALGSALGDLTHADGAAVKAMGWEHDGPPRGFGSILWVASMTSGLKA